MTKPTLHRFDRFQSMLPARGATKVEVDGVYVNTFQSTLPARGATERPVRRAPAGRFQSTLPARGATFRADVLNFLLHLFQSTLPARGATALVGAQQLIEVISIHAPRTGSDTQAIGSKLLQVHFNPRSPHGEREHRYVMVSQWVGFQSTLPARGATITTAGRATPVIFQSTLPARGATNPPDEGPVARAISIHAPRTGSDGRRERPKTATKRFQSTLPARGATTDGDAQAPPRKISIHAPRTGSDRAASQSQQPPAISIHAPRTGSDTRKGI